MQGKVEVLSGEVQREKTMSADAGTGKERGAFAPLSLKSGLQQASGPHIGQQFVEAGEQLTRIFRIGYSGSRRNGPRRPVGPAGPIAPAGPVGPAAPAGPAAPVGPAGPAGPIAPAGPIGPTDPGNPGIPAGPTGPGRPRGPLGPGGPGMQQTLPHSPGRP